MFSQPVPLIVLGCFHEVQSVIGGATYNADRQRFRELLRSVVSQSQIKFIGEEATFFKKLQPPMETFAETLAAELKLGYRNIDVSLECKRTIYHRPPRQYNDITGEVEDLLASDKYAFAWNLVREYHMFKVALKEIQQFPAPSLLIVGRLHVEPIAALWQAEAPSLVEIKRLLL
jgi:hypothetical protein